MKSPGRTGLRREQAGWPEAYSEFQRCLEGSPSETRLAQRRKKTKWEQGCNRPLIRALSRSVPLDYIPGLGCLRSGGSEEKGPVEHFRRLPLHRVKRINQISRVKPKNMKMLIFNRNGRIWFNDVLIFWLAVLASFMLSHYFVDKITVKLLWVPFISCYNVDCNVLNRLLLLDYISIE